MQKAQKNYYQTNEELAKLYFKEFPALDSKSKQGSPSFKKENNPIDDENSKNHVNRVKLNGRIFKRKKSSHISRNTRNNYDDWNMDFEGAWEMEEDLIDEFLRTHNNLKRSTQSIERQTSFLDENVNMLQKEIDDLFSFLPSQLISETVIDIKSYQNKNKDEGYNTPDSSFFSLDTDYEGHFLDDKTDKCVTFGIENVNLNTFKSKFDQNVKNLWKNNSSNRTGMFPDLYKNGSFIESKQNATKWQSNDFIVCGTNLNRSIWSENQNSKLLHADPDCKDLNIDYLGSNFQGDDGEKETIADTASFEIVIDESSCPEITLSNHSRNSSFVRVGRSKCSNPEHKSHVNPVRFVSNSIDKIDCSENLLTSEKTHFRPIKETFIDGHTFQISYSPKKINFIRSDSGSIYLNSLKYLEFNDAQNENGLIVKFCVRQNEKSIQTEINDCSINFENVINLERYICRKSQNSEVSHNWHEPDVRSNSINSNMLDFNIWSPDKSKKCLENNNNTCSNLWNQCDSCNLQIKTQPANNTLKAELASDGEELMYDLQCMLNLSLNYDNIDEPGAMEDYGFSSDIFMKVNKIVSDLLNPDTTKTLTNVLDKTLLAASYHKHNIKLENDEHIFTTALTEMKTIGGRKGIFKKGKNCVHYDNADIEDVKSKEKRFDRKRRHSACHKLISTMDENIKCLHIIRRQDSNIHFENMIELKCYTDQTFHNNFQTNQNDTNLISRPITR